MNLRAYLLIIILVVFPSTSYSQFISPLPESIPGDTVAVYKKRGERISNWLLPLPRKVIHPADKLYTLYREKGKFSYLNFFSGAISKNRAYISTDLFSGLGGSMRVSLSSAFVVVKLDESDSTDTEIVEDKNAAITRLIANGGSLSLKIGQPLFAGGGSTWRDVSSWYFNIGLLNGLSDITSENSEDPIGILGFTGEYIGSFAIRNTTDYSVIAEILLGVKLGYYRLTKNFKNFNSQDVGFLQFFAGIRQSGILKYTVIYSCVPDEFSDFISEWVFNIQATTF